MLTPVRARPHPRYIYAHSVQNRLRLTYSRLFVLAPTLTPTRPHSPSDAHSRSHSLTPAHAHTRAHTLGEATVSGIDTHDHSRSRSRPTRPLYHTQGFDTYTLTLAPSPTRPRWGGYGIRHRHSRSHSHSPAHTQPRAITLRHSPPARPRPRSLTHPHTGEATVSGIDTLTHSRSLTRPHTRSLARPRSGRLRYQA